MFRAMRRSDKQISPAQAEAILARAEYGTLATVNEDGYPYAVPMNFVYFGGNVYFHCALEGQKLDNIANEPRVCFSAVAESEIAPDKLTTRYQSRWCSAGRRRCRTTKSRSRW